MKEGLIQQSETVLDMIKEVDECLPIRETEQLKSAVRNMKDKIRIFIKVVLQDNERMQELQMAEDKASTATRQIKIKESALQQYFITYLEELRIILVSIHRELQLRASFKEKEVSMDKVTKKFLDAKKEADKRGAVLETKLAGGSIELIDMLRSELKSRTKYEERFNKIESKLDKVLKHLEDKK